MGKRSKTYNWLATQAAPRSISRVDPRKISESCTTQLGMIMPTLTVVELDSIERRKKIAEVGGSKIRSKYSFHEYLEMDAKMRAEGCKEYFETVTAST